jgi:cobalt-zinc-cadmium efflux system protein
VHENEQVDDRPDRHDDKGKDGRGHGGHHHGAAGHAHGVSKDADGRYLTIAFLLIVGFMAFEVVVGILAHSLALLSDAAHMLTDAGALALSLVILRYVQRPDGEALTYGRRRAEVLSGQANGGRGDREHCCSVGHGERQPSKPEHRGQLPAHRDRPV